MFETSTTKEAQIAVVPGGEGDSLSTPETKPQLQRFTAQKFVWGAGVECSFIPHLKVNQFEWTQHNQFWREDLKKASDLGLNALRYALPWHEIESQRGSFDWKLADERVEYAHSLGLDLYLDVMHFGTPTWLRQAAGDVEFPEALESFTEAIVTRYRHLVSTWCPCNEPLVLSLFSGDFGFWPPHARKWRGYMSVLTRVVQAVNRSIRAIRRAQPEATVLLCDNAEAYRSREPELAAEVRRRNLRRFLVLDLLMGRVDHRHPLFNWATSYGLNELDLEWFRTNPQSPDVLGLDYYPNSEWQLERGTDGIRQRRSEMTDGIHGIATAYYNRYGLPMMLTETSIDGKPINREIWLEDTLEGCRQLRSEGIPMLGYFWWPLFDQLDWDGALTHRVGKIHEVGIYSLRRQADGVLKRQSTPLTEQYKKIIAGGNERVGELDDIVLPADEGEQGLPIGVEIPAHVSNALHAVNLVELPVERKSGNGSGNGHGAGNGHGDGSAIKVRAADPAPGMSAEPDAMSAGMAASTSAKATDRYGIVVFSHLRWGFVWQRPQQFLSRFARKHRILFVEEPFWDVPEGSEPRVEYHKVMPNVAVVAPHFPSSWMKNPALPERLREITRTAIDTFNENGAFDRPLLWYYSPMDSAWSLGYFPNRGIVYDCMDELSKFTGAPPALVRNEARLIKHADVLFAGGLELGESKKKLHHNVHAFGCGVEFDHFARASDPQTVIPPDIDFMNRPIMGWFGVVDERVDCEMVGEMARRRPDWSFAMVGPVVKIDPNHLPHYPNLYWLGGRDYQVLPNYCRAFDVCMMPFAMNAATQFINPTKGLEYMATAKPIVSTPVRDVVRQWTDIIRIANNVDEFIGLADEALRAGPQDERVKRGIELALKNSWEVTVQKLQDLIKAAITPEGRPSAKPIAPLSGAELESSYVSTQGS